MKKLAETILQSIKVQKRVSLKDKVAPHIVQIISRLQKAGFETYLVGGAVRDIIIDREPKDYDISTSATPNQVRRVFGKRRARIIGRRFKIVHLYHGREIIEISTFRAAPKATDELIDTPFAQPIARDNEYGTSLEDAFRRDFTVNAVFYDPPQNKLIDHTKHGISDLKRGIVRVIGDPQVRFSEDPVRMLRALKLVGQYGFKLTGETQEALEKSLEQITLCSKSRLTLELEKILKKPYSEKILKVFKEYGFLKYFLPNVAENWKTESNQLALNLLSTHCKRLQEETCPDYLSTVLALMSIPLINKNFSDDAANCLWNYYQGIEKDMKEMIRHIFYPYNFPKYIIFATIDAILLQKNFCTRRQARKTRHHPHFRIAREVATDLNRTIWQQPDLERYWSTKRRSR